MTGLPDVEISLHGHCPLKNNDDRVAMDRREGAL